MKSIFTGILLAALPIITQADCNAGSCIDVKIQEMQVQSDGNVYIQTSGTETALNCTPDAGVFVRLNANTDGGKIIFSSLLASQAAGKSVNIRIVDNTSPCQVIYVSVK